MECDRYWELLSARLDGALSEAEEQELEAHLASCPDCRALLEELKELRESFDALGEEEAPEGFAQGVMDRIRASEAPKVIPLWKRPQVRALAGLAACLVLVVGIYSASRPRYWDKTVKMDVTARSFNQDALAEGEECPQVNADLVSPEAADAPQIAAYAAPEDTDPADMQKAAPSPAADGLQGDLPLVVGMTTLERMPEGAAELIPPETAVTPTDDGRGRVYLDLPLEVLDQIEQLAREQGIGVTAERCSAPEVEVQYNLEILQ